MNCPICKELISWQDNPTRPFCSERCRLLDLEGWLHERYRVSHEGNEGERDEPTDMPDGR